MRVWVRSALTAASCLSLIGMAGCSALGGSEAPSPPPKDELASVDPCQILTPQELSAVGVPGPGQPISDVSWVNQCMYDGNDVGVTVYKDTRSNVEALHSQAQWAKWDPIDVAGHTGVTAINTEETKSRICETMFDSGNGRISVQVSANHPGDESSCPKSQEIAKQIAPRMPQKQ